MKTTGIFAVWCILAALVFGTVGGILSDQILIPSLTNTFPGLFPKTESGSGTVIRNPEIVTEKLFTSAVIDVAKNANPSVVSIVATKELTRYKTNPNDLFFYDPFGGSVFGNPFGGSIQPEVETRKEQVSGGTGFIVTNDGKIVTNKHVVTDPDAEYTAVLNDGSEFSVTVVSRDPVNDLAIVQIQPKDGNMPANMRPLKLADPKSIQVGQLVVAIGNALGEFENTVTMGVISAEGRNIVASDGTAQGEELSNLIQTDAAINPGNSGGPLLSLDGDVVGVNTAIAQGSNGIGFAIPAAEVDFVLRSVSKYGKIVRPFLGVVYRNNSPEVAKQFSLNVDYGAIIQESNDGEESIVKDGPAAKAGLMAGDIVLEVNGEKITEANGLKDVVNNFEPEQKVTLKVLRNSKEMNIDVTLGKREDTSKVSATASNPTQSAGFLGVNFRMMTRELQQQMRANVSEGALLYNDFSKNIPAVVKDSPADKAGLRAGDIIVKVKGKDVNTANPLDKVMQEFKSGEEVTIGFVRDGMNMEKAVKLGDRPKESLPVMQN